MEELKPNPNSYVTFTNGAKGRINVVGKFISPSFPFLNDVLLVKGLTTNLINIIQLCDQGGNVNFNKSKCSVTRKDQEVLMKGPMSKDNYYMSIKSQPSSCLISKTLFDSLNSLKNDSKF